MPLRARSFFCHGCLRHLARSSSRHLLAVAWRESPNLAFFFFFLFLSLFLSFSLFLSLPLFLSPSLRLSPPLSHRALPACMRATCRTRSRSTAQLGRALYQPQGQDQHKLNLHKSLINVRDAEGFTALARSVRAERPAACEYLLSQARDLPTSRHISPHLPRFLAFQISPHLSTSLRRSPSIHGLR